MPHLRPAGNFGKKVKQTLQRSLKIKEVPLLSPVRRIASVNTEERICAITFENGPVLLPPAPLSPDTCHKGVTEWILDILEEFHAKGTFFVVGDTSRNYPDTMGKLGTMSWFGHKYDHYPAIHQDQQGGVVHSTALVNRMISEGHEIGNHSFSHRLFGAGQSGNREFYESFQEVEEDARLLHEYMRKKHNYTMKIARPPHNLNKIQGGFHAFDLYHKFGYQYIASSFDGAGVFPEKNYDSEVKQCYFSMAQLLGEDSDYFCGQIIKLPDGFNLSGRSPVVEGLRKQLALLQRYGYEIVTVSELLERSAFSDVGIEVKSAEIAKNLLKRDKCLVYRDNTLRLYQLLTLGELAMIFFGVEQEVQRQSMLGNYHQLPLFRDVPFCHPYRGAVEFAVKEGYFPKNEVSFGINRHITAKEFNFFCEQYYDESCQLTGDSLTHRAMIKALNHLESSYER